MPFTTCTYKWAPLSTSSFEVGSIIYIELFVKLKSTLLGVNSQSAPSSTTCVLCPVIYRPTTRVWRRLIMTKKSSQSWSYGLRIKQLWVYRMVILLSSFFIVLLHFPFPFNLLHIMKFYCKGSSTNTQSNDSGLWNSKTIGLWQNSLRFHYVLCIFIAHVMSYFLIAGLKLKQI